MPAKSIQKKKGELVPGTTIECRSGRFVAFYEHRTDIIASGENEKDALKNLRAHYKTVMKYEEKKQREDNKISLPASFKTHTFRDRIER
jgi:hypothetical protein